jgi:transitional endoplasmic reticulum ATPase
MELPGSKRANRREIKLKVAEAQQDDVNKGIVRIDSQIMKALGIQQGSIVEIEGSRKSVAIAGRAFPSDIGLAIIRMDGLTRKNAGTLIGEYTAIRAVDVKPATTVAIAPAQKGIAIQVLGSTDAFKRALLGRAMIKGDIISLGGTKRRRVTLTGNPFFDDVFRLMDEEGFGLGLGLGDQKYLVVSTSPKDTVLITEDTEVEVLPEAVELKDEKLPGITYEDIGGLQEELKKIREMIELPLKHPELFETLGIQPPKGVLLYGAPGTGKTLIAKAVATETNANFISIAGPEIMNKFVGEAEKKLRELFAEAEKSSPSIIFIDEIDAIAPKREESYGEVERRVVAQLLALMDGLKSRGRVIVIAATNRPDALDPALRRGGRFDREIEIGVPNKEGRLDILKIHTRNMPLIPTPKKEYLEKKVAFLKEEVKKLDADLKSTVDVHKKKEISDEINNNKSQIDILSKYLRTFNNDYVANEKSLKDIPSKDGEKLWVIFREGMLQELADVTHGFVGADVEGLCKEAAMAALRRVTELLNIDWKASERVPQEILEKLKVTETDFKDALKMVRPSAMREVLIETPKVKWDDIGGLEDAKQEIKEAVEWPLKNPEAFKRLGIRPPRGILIYGPSGCGKTLLAKAVATESQANFICVKGPEVISKWVGESERAIREIFKKARQVSPCIVFFDEIDSVASKRGGSSDNKVTERVVDQILTEMDGLEEMADVVVLAATNRPELLDSALLRPGRFDRFLLVPPPSEKMRVDIFKIHLQNMPIEKGITAVDLAKRTEGYSGADMEAICREAAMLALREDIKSKIVKQEHFEAAMQKVRPSLSKREIEKYTSSIEAAKRGETAVTPAYMG